LDPSSGENKSSFGPREHRKGKCGVIRQRKIKPTIPVRGEIRSPKRSFSHSPLCRRRPLEMRSGHDREAVDTTQADRRKTGDNVEAGPPRPLRRMADKSYQIDNEHRRRDVFLVSNMGIPSVAPPR